MFLPARDSFSPEVRQNFRLNRRPEERVQVLGGAMDLVRPEEVFHFVAGKIAARESAVVANHNLHSLYLIRKDEKIAEFFRTSDLIEVDSVPVIFWARIVGRASRRFHRCTYLDWRDAFWERAIQENWKVFFVGGAPGVGEKATTRIQADWPDAQMRTHHGYFDVTQGLASRTRPWSTRSTPTGPTSCWSAWACRARKSGCWRTRPSSGPA
jgi:N-acetylglucosaminyldiphosphoundecaprenol N-acetyl-beta-D-mannosaminyltransferase